MSDSREQTLPDKYAQGQNLRLANMMLRQQGQINAMQKVLKEVIACPFVPASLALAAKDALDEGAWDA